MEDNNSILKSLIFSMKGDMKFVSIMLIIIGAASSLTIVGLIYGIPMILAGLRLKDSADNMNNYLTTDQKSFFELGIENLGQHFKFMKIQYIIMIVMLVLYILFLVFVFFTTLSTLSGAGY
ncbi:MAG: hypothetical protein HUU43_06375 [Ignavibacteriaceae bacterium]|nr:DUF5362 domain-containing protein [Ignavibacteriaceae bacterium]NUM70454.1 hypothetical protein [Ignavibacteriaceae bacterium]